MNSHIVAVSIIFLSALGTEPVAASGAQSAAAPAAPPSATAFHITVDHAGVTTSGGALAPQETPLWSVALDGPSSYPVIADGRVFVTTGSTTGINGTELHAFDARTGARLWGPITLGGMRPWSAATYEGGKLFVVNNEGFLSSYDGASGTLGWIVQLPGQYFFSAAPTASNGIVYVGGAGVGGTVYAVDETTGAVRWTAQVGNGDQSSPAIGPNGVYVSYPCQVYSFDTTSGTLNWHNDSGCSGGGGKTPVVASGRLYVRDSGGLIYEASSGATLGAFPISTLPAIKGDRGFFLSNGTLQALDVTTSTVRWSFHGDGTLTSAPIVVDQTVIEASDSGYLYGLDAGSGTLQWQVSTGARIPATDEQNVSQPPTGLAIADGVLVVPAGSTLLAYSIFGPPAPTNATAAGGVGLVRLAWSQAAGAASYNVYMGASSGAEQLTPVQTGVMATTTTVTDPLTMGTPYYFTIKAISADGISAPSNEVAATPQAPATPTDLAAEAGVGSAALSWTPVNGATSYNIYAGTSAGGEASAPVLSGVTVANATLTGLTPGSEYFFVVRAVAYTALSDNSNEASTTPLVLGAPTSLSAIAGDARVSLSWNAVAGATSYNVYEGVASGNESSTPLQSGITATSTTIASLQNGTTYYFTVRAVGAAGTSAMSNEVAVTPTAPTARHSGGGGGGALTWLELPALLGLALVRRPRRARCPSVSDL